MDILLFFFLPIYSSLKHAHLLCLRFHMLISVQVYSCNSNHYSIALACTETEIKNKLKKKYRQEKSLKRTPAVGVMQMQKLRSLF